MTQYKLKDDFVNGVLPNTNGKPNIIFKKGDFIEGQQVEKFIFNKNMKGIMAKPTVATARVENADGLVFVPFSSLEIIVNLSDNTGVATTLESGAGKYKVNTRTSILKTNPNKKDAWGDFGTDVVGTLEVGDVIEIAKTGGGGRGIAMTPYLFFADGTYILGYDADKVDDSTPLTSKLTFLTRFTPQGFLQKHKNHLLILGALVIGYFAYKKFNK